MTHFHPIRFGSAARRRLSHTPERTERPRRDVTERTVEGENRGGSGCAEQNVKQAQAEGEKGGRGGKAGAGKTAQTDSARGGEERDGKTERGGKRRERRHGEGGRRE